MRWLWRIGIGLIALVILIVGGTVAMISTTDFTAYRNEIASAVKNATGRDLQIKGKIDKTVLTLSPSIVVTDVTFANAAWGTRPTMMTAKRIELEVALLPLISGTIKIKRFRLIGADVLLETDKRGRGNWEFASVKRPAGKTPAASAAAATQTGPHSAGPKFKDLQIRDSFFTFRDGRSGLVSKVRIKEIAARAPGFNSDIALRTRGAYNGVSISTDGTLGKLGDLFKGVKGYPVAMKVQFGKSVLQFAVKVDMAGSLPAISGAVDSSLLDLDEIAAATAATSEKKKASTQSQATRRAKRSTKRSAKRQSGGLFPKDELPLGILGLFNADLKVTLKRLVVASNAFDSVKADVKLKDGRMAATDFSTSLTNGQVAGDLILDVSSADPKVAAKMRATQISLGKVLQKAVGQPLVGSYATIRVDISGRGRSVHGIVSTLRGPVTAVLGPGSIANTMFNIASTDLFSLISMKPGKLRVVCGVFALRFNGRGVGSGRRMVLDTNRITFYGSGAVNLPRERLNFRIVPAGKGVSLTQIASVFPINIAGRLTAPQVSLDKKAIPGQVLNKALGIVDLPFDAAGALFGRSKGKKRRGCGARAGGKSPSRGLLKNLKGLNPFR